MAARILRMATVRATTAALLLLVTVLVATVGAAYGADDAQTPTGPQPRPAPDFFFGRPRGSVGVRGSWVFARAGSDLFAFVQDQLTIDGGAFNAPAIGADLAIGLSPRLDVVVGYEYSGARVSSEYRDFVTSDFLPIPQSTSLRTSGFSASVKASLTPRGRSVSRYAWIPSTATPFVGAGGGFLWYEFQQHGSFVDFVDNSIFTDVFQSKGWTPTAHLFGGVDVRVWRHLGMTMEGRYVWAAGKLSSDFVGFDPIDLAGFRMSAGLHVTF